MCFKYPFEAFKCGKCPECLQDIRREWSLRLQLHTLYSGEIPFFAHLTYDNKHVPINEFGKLTLSKYDIQLFLKRLRQNVNKYYESKDLVPQSIKYYISGEYGPNGTHRPHYHCVIFGLPKDFQEDEAVLLLQKSWQNGYVKDTSCWLKSYAQLHYVTKYMINFFDEDFSKKVAPFRLCSSGLGKPFIDYALQHNLYDINVQRKFKCDYKVSNLNGHRVPVFWYFEKPLVFDYVNNEMVINKLLVNFRDFIEFSEYLHGKQKVYRFPLPRYFQDKLYTDDFRSALGVVKKYLLQQSNSTYYSDYGDYDTLSSVPMWLQIKRYNWQHKKKNKKDKKVDFNKILND